jgi:hypothetical protein
MAKLSKVFRSARLIRPRGAKIKRICRWTMRTAALRSVCACRSIFVDVLSGTT